MPFAFNPQAPALLPQHALPTHLEHRPVFAMPYEAFDGPTPANTDTHFISVGFSQYNSNELSIKTMRHTGSRWSRQAEELPLHRPIDMTLFLAKVIFDSPNQIVDIPLGTMTHQTSDLAVLQEPLHPAEITNYINLVQTDQPYLKTRLNALLNVLNNLKTAGLI